MSEPNIWGRRNEPHTTPETQWMLCDGCRSLSCIPQEKSKLHPWKYYCGTLHKSLTLSEMYAMTTEKCPEGRVRNLRRFR